MCKFELIKDYNQWLKGLGGLSSILILKIEWPGIRIQNVQKLQLYLINYCILTWLL